MHLTARSINNILCKPYTWRKRKKRGKREREREREREGGKIREREGGREGETQRQGGDHITCNKAPKKTIPYTLPSQDADKADLS